MRREGRGIRSDASLWNNKNKTDRQTNRQPGVLQKSGAKAQGSTQGASLSAPQCQESTALPHAHTRTPHTTTETLHFNQCLEVSPSSRYVGFFFLLKSVYNIYIYILYIYIFIYIFIYPIYTYCTPSSGLLHSCLLVETFPFLFWIWPEVPGPDAILEIY